MFTSNNWILFYMALMFIASAVCTYTKSLKESWIFLIIMLVTACLGSWLWVVASRRLDKISDLIWFSLVWDMLMVAAYYLIPLFFYEHKMNWQSWAAISLIIAGIMWLKLQSEV